MHKGHRVYKIIDSKRTWWGEKMQYLVKVKERNEFRIDPTTMYYVTIISDKLRKRLGLRKTYGMAKPGFDGFVSWVNTER